MNSINFSGRTNFPLSIETMAFLQNMISQAAKWTALGGNNYILSGVETASGNVSDGWVVINGEVLPFVGGQAQTNVYIEEVSQNVDTQGYDYTNVYKARTARLGFGTGQVAFNSFVRIETNVALKTMLDNLQLQVNALQPTPTGVIVMWSGSVDNIPSGWALCDGLQGRPNLQGRFVVGYQNTDPDYNTIRGTGGSKQITLTETHIPSHKHIVPWGENTAGGGFAPEWGLATGYSSNNRQGSRATDNDNSYPYTSPTGDGQPHENRPPYYVLAYIIKL